MTFYWTMTSLILSGATLLLAAGCCWLSWHRSGYQKTMGWLELFRFLFVGLVVFALNQPEVTTTVRPDEKPVIVVLHDQSRSMETIDVVDVDGGSPESRINAVVPLIGDELWEPLGKQFQVVVEPFSSKLPDAAAGTDINTALATMADQHPLLRAVVLLSDGDWNDGMTPSSAATDLRMLGVPVFSVGMGSEQRLPDIQITSSGAPTFGLAGKTIRIPFRLTNWLPRDQSVVVTLTGTGGEPESKAVQVRGMGRINETIEWKTDQTGEYDLTLSVPVMAEEAVKDNNEVSLPMSIRNEALRVLIVESYPRWEFRYLRNALERDPGVDVDCLMFHPDLKGLGGGRGYLEGFPDDTELFRYDVVFLGDVGIDGDQLTVDNCESIRQLVRSHAGGLVFLPGLRGYHLSLMATELEELYPVVPDSTKPKGIGHSEPSRFALTESGRRSLLTRLEADDERNEETWRSLPGFQWYAATRRARIGTDILVTHDSASTRFGRIPLIATRTSGTGKVLFMGTDGAWRWRRGVEDLYHYRFWGQVVRWMAYQRNMSQGESMRLFYSPDRPEAGNELALNVNVIDNSGEPLRSGNVTVQIRGAAGKADFVQLAAAGDDSWGLFTGTFTPEEGGHYTLTTTCEETGAQLETTLSVQGLERERIGQPARFDVLREISEISRGELTEPSNVASVVKSLSELPEPELLKRRFRIWSHPAWAALLILLLGAFWSARKLAGLA